MPRFRPSPSPRHPTPPPTLDEARAIAAEVFRPAHFFLAPPLELEWEHAPREEVVWEVFQGRLLDRAHTRQRRTFEAWNAYQLGPEGRPGEPLLALKLDAEARQVHVVRGLDRYVWEGYDSGGNVYLSRERRKWARELTGTVRLDQLAGADELRDELMCQLFHAVVGARLPLTSVEAPLPGFTFGELFYCYRPGAAPAEGSLRSAAEVVAKMLSPASSWREWARLLELLLRTSADFAELLPGFLKRWHELGRTGANLVGLLRTLFNDVSLSPYTDFAGRALGFVRLLEDSGELTAEQAVDFLGHLLRRLGRHLTAYDLVTFHHRGANYPDALLLDAVLKDYLARIERSPELFLTGAADDEGTQRVKRLRRRALRQGWLVRRRYEGHPVPDLPTSPGENSRVLPPSHPRVPEEQITNPARRTRRLYDNDPLPAHLGPLPFAKMALAMSRQDLEHPEEARELGLALFLDRPFGGAKAPAEPDGTLLLASLAYSRAVARERLDALQRDLDLLGVTAATANLLDALGIPAPPPSRLELPAVEGLPLDRVGPPARPGTVSLADARRSAPDFVFLYTTPGGVAALLAQFDFGPLADLPDLYEALTTGPVLLARSPEGPGVRVYDRAFRPLLELEVRAGSGYSTRAEQEYPAGGLRVTRVWPERDLRGETFVLRPRA
jgi:hypothetical protein